MTQPFTDALTVCFEAMARLTLLSLIGFVLFRRNVITADGLNSFVRLVIDVLVPVQIVLAMLGAFTAETLADGSPIILFIILTISVGGLLMRGLQKLWRGGSDLEDRGVASLAMFQNSFYLPLPFLLSILPAGEHPLAVVYLGIALFTLFPLQWTWGTFILRDRDGPAPSLKDSILLALNGPFIAVLVGAILSMFPPVVSAARGEAVAPLLLRILLGAMEMIGSTAGPLACVVLGAIIGAARIGGNLRLRHVTLVVLVRLLAMPALVLWLLTLLPFAFDPMVRLVIVLQAASPPAVNLAIAARRFGGPWETMGATQIPAYAAALFTLPLWVALEMIGAFAAPQSLP